MATSLTTYNATLAANTAASLVTVSSAHTVTVVSIEVSGGTSGGQVTFTKNSGSADVFSWSMSVAAGQLVVLDHKFFLPAGYVFKATSDTAGVQVSVSAADQG